MQAQASSCCLPSSVMAPFSLLFLTYFIHQSLSLPHFLPTHYNAQLH